MSDQVQWRRGTTAENDVFTGASGEITVDTDLNQLRVHDGATPGGVKTLMSGGPADVTTLTVSGLADLSAASSGQIKFPATQNASANANTLDDYAETSFSPTLTGSTIPPDDITYLANFQVGEAVKIGKLVHFEVSLALATFTLGSGAGNLTLDLDTLPNSQNVFGGIQMSRCVVNISSVNLSVGALWVTAVLNNASNTLIFYENFDNSVQLHMPLSALAAGSQVYVTGSYIATA